ncbi:phage tail sheath subtilisin-like domain-containing protein [Myxococcota bacterium]|nr:phage tail sheath subtilisin-like domain-containing protein [Myxococcota bacterium]
MGTYQTPGIYVEEVSTGPRPIQAVGTSTAAFVGRAPKKDAFPKRPVALVNWSQFVRQFTNDGDGEGNVLAQAVFGFFHNGGRRCYVVNVDADALADGLEALEAVDEIAIVAAPGFSGAKAWGLVLDHCERLEDRVAILDSPEVVDDLDQLTEVATEAPAARTDAGAAPRAPEVKGLRPPQSDRGFGTYYFPWISVRDPLSKSGKVVWAPPSGHVAGVWARSDATRGVHKAPANEGLRGVLDLRYRISRDEQAELNDAGVNCIRFFPREGPRIWGARTLAPASSEWRYVNVRRLFNMIEESIAESTRWVVFEPNDASLWKSIRRDVTAFLTRLWRDGALVGDSPEQAFFVQCDRETNPPEVVDAGQVVTVIGLAPVKPAEFIIFRIGQTASGPVLEA